MRNGSFMTRQATPATRFPGLTIMMLVARRVGKSTALWGLVFGSVVVSSAVSYTNAFPTAASRHLLPLALGANPGLKAIFGPARNIDTVAGFVAWRSLGIVSLFGAVWGLLTGTKYLRGEEEAGRWEMLLSGRTTRGRAAAQAVAGLGIGLAVLYGVTAAIVIAARHLDGVSYSVSDGLFFALALVASAAVFLVIGMAMSQLAPTRRSALTWSAAVFGMAFVARVVASTVPSWDWLRWATPLGWISEMHPLTGGEPWLLLPLGGFIAVCVTAGVFLAGRRDLGGSTIPERDTAKARTGLLGSPFGLAVRLTGGNLFGWLVGLGAAAFVMGIVAKAAQNLASVGIQKMLARIGASSDLETSFLGLIFFIFAAILAMFAASQAGATREEEADGYLDNLLVRPVSRTAWLGGRIAIAVAGICVLGLAVGAASWLGVASQNSDLAFGKLLAAGVNIIPPAVLVFGIGVLVHGLLPRRVSLVTYGVVAWSFLVQLIGSVGKVNETLLDLSIFHHMAMAPAADVNWGAAAAMAGIGLAAATVGLASFTRRDLANE